ncbi:Atrochrysone carboxyl ACP thioesterase [Penicillium oxalicum]|uniref:Atrochrysone carboxyl ACP thioesterase n=1 Tax=Penicillium oxalicum TaxID=69781 RepID=UPI0020B8E255|nr:Atrochrysone carboxyl ACP thioesterase [Penicillium oxalicum]KAI2795183.1 Atrochrysone carboxyl ACP thioesterase [Penicillium oxalicum]
MATQLVALPEVERLSASVIRILGANPGKRILIDSGQGEEAWAKNLQTVLTDEKATVHQALLTHWHGDHVGGVADLKRLCPQVQVFKCALELDGESEEYARIEDGQVFRVEGATLKALFTPGHTEDHMAFVLEEEDAIFTGDNVLGHGTAVFENLKVYLASLHRMRERVGGRGYPGHGAVLESAAVRIQEYIKHRQQREEEVIRVLRYGQLEAPVGVVDSEIEARPALTPLQVVKQIYVGVPESLHLPASHGVSLVLEKLREEGKTVQEASGAWRLVGGKSTL